jgi:hypothetical protein
VCYHCAADLKTTILMDDSLMNDKANPYLTILTKNSMFSFLGIVRAESLVDLDGQTRPVTAVVKLDPREREPLMKQYDTNSEARRNYEDAVNTSVERGWSVVYRGQPLFG